MSRPPIVWVPFPAVGFVAAWALLLFPAWWIPRDAKRHGIAHWWDVVIGQGCRAEGA